MKLKVIIVICLLNFSSLSVSAGPIAHYEDLRQNQMISRTDSVKETDLLPIRPAPITCAIDPTTLVLTEITQNRGRSLPNLCHPGWFNRIRMSGGVNFDFGKWGNRNTNFTGENDQRFSLNDVYLNISASVNDWVNGLISLSYSNTSLNSWNGWNNGSLDNDMNWAGREWLFKFSDVYKSNKLSLEQAFFTLGNLTEIPLYLQVGKQFQDFGRYEIHPITRSLTQVLSETLASSGKVGFILPNGLNGSVFIFDNPLQRFETNKNHTSTNYGLSIGFDHPNDQLGWSIGAGYLYNLIGVNDVSHGVKLFNDEGFHHHVGAIALYGDLNSGPFSINLRWTGAVQGFSPWDLPQHGWTDLMDNGQIYPGASGAKPRATGIQGGYSFDKWNVPNNIHIGYQMSHEAAGIGLPKNRWVVGYGIDAWPHTHFGLEWDRDSHYSKSAGGSDGVDNLFTIRSSIKFY